MPRAKKAAVAEAEPVAIAVVAETITALKGLNSNFACAPNGTAFQFEVGKTYSVTGAVKACRNGFHAVSLETPLHVWDFYPPIGEDGKLSRYAEVELSGATDKEDEPKGIKIAAASITIKAELTLPDFIRRAVTAIIDGAKSASKDTASDKDSAKLAASGDSAQLAASGDSAQLAASGYSAKLAASGDSAKLAASGDYAKLAASGDSAKLAASGDSAQLAASGDYAKLAASGYSAKLAASGDSAQLAASGDYAKLAASGKNSVIVASAPGCIASGADGTWISLAEFRDGKCVGFAIGCIGQDGLKPDTNYRALGGKLAEV